MPLASPRSAASRGLLHFARNLRFPTLFVLFLLLFIADLMVPDVIPLVDELLLGLATLLLGAWKKRRAA